MSKKLLSLLIPALYFKMYAVDGEGAAETLLDLDSVLEQSLDEVEDAPEYVMPPDGSYMLTIKDAKSERYKTNDKETKEEIERLRIRIVYAVVETKELLNEDAVPVADGSLFSEQFMTNQDGLSFFKRQAKNVLGEETIKGAKISEILKELTNNHVFPADVRIKHSKPVTTANGQRKVFENVQVRIKGQAADIPAAG